MPAPRLALSPHLGWPHWLAALLFGLMLVLLVLIVSWLLRACAPVDPSLNFTMIETDAPPAAQSPPDITPALRASLDQTMADGKTLAGELASLQAEFEIKVASCKPIEPPPFQADRWAKKDLSILKGCWVLGHDTRGWRGEIGSPEREDNCTTKAPRMCFDANGHGQSKRPWCARSQVQFIVRGQLRRNSRMMERSRQRRRQRNANEALRRVGNIQRPHAGASMTIMRCVGKRISPQTTHPVLGLRKLEFRREQ